MRYRTIVADPPWPIESFPAWFKASARSAREMALGENPTPYETMSLDEIQAMPVRDLAEADRWHVNGDRGGSHLYLWTITEFLPQAYEIAAAWGFKTTAVLAWCKPPGRYKLGGTFPANVEFVLFARRGSPPAAPERALSRWFTWPVGRHSQKPEAFFDLVERISPGPYLELFARRQRLGWDTWGDEALQPCRPGSRVSNQGEPNYCDEEDFMDDLDCTHCGGEGTCDDNANPLWDCDDQLHPCHACNGTGRRRDQVIF